MLLFFPHVLIGQFEFQHINQILECRNNKNCNKESNDIKKERTKLLTRMKKKKETESDKSKWVSTNFG